MASWVLQDLVYALMVFPVSLSPPGAIVEWKSVTEFWKVARRWVSFLDYEGCLALPEGPLSRANCSSFLMSCWGFKMRQPSETWSKKGKNGAQRACIHFSRPFTNTMDSSSFPCGTVGRSLAPPFLPLPFSALPTGGGMSASLHKARSPHSCQALFYFLSC